MRSRYSAFALGLGDYLWRTWHPRTRPERVSLDDKSAVGMRLEGEILAADGSVIPIAGDALDISTVQDSTLLVTPDTVIYAVDTRNIFLNEAVTGV